jgi:putative oxidoreductase
MPIIVAVPPGRSDSKQRFCPSRGLADDPFATQKEMDDANFGAERIKDEAILVARILLVVLFVVFGWGKLTNYSGTVGYMAQLNLPTPSVTALVVIAVEVFVSLAIAFGAWTRPLVLLLALYTLGTALIGHHFWTMEGAARNGNAINFYKNISIIGGLLLLYVTGAGRYSVDSRLGRATTYQVSPRLP